MATWSWQAGTASGPLLIGTLIQASISINDPSYVWQNWARDAPGYRHHTDRLCIQRVGSTSYDPELDACGACFRFHYYHRRVLGSRSTKLCGSGLPPDAPNDGGWSSMGLALMVGQISARSRPSTLASVRLICTVLYP